jgi:hypothetical protein
VAQPGANARGKPSHLEAEDAHFSRGGDLQTRDHAQQRALARSAGAEHADELAAPDLEGRALQRSRVAFSGAVHAEDVA